ncbi:hypothetical protein A5880_000371 [Enterococcus sp. 4G2_DIV0659]|uniref:Uncharacterized protein n=1 Tax=Candidatus Enterococcus mansonii TaxID=1834181 RepID=A0ABU8IAX6_9ENTE
MRQVSKVVCELLQFEARINTEKKVAATRCFFLEFFLLFVKKTVVCSGKCYNEKND